MSKLVANWIGVLDSVAWLEKEGDKLIFWKFYRTDYFFYMN